MSGGMEEDKSNNVYTPNIISNYVLNKRLDEVEKSLTELKKFLQRDPLWHQIIGGGY